MTFGGGVEHSIRREEHEIAVYGVKTGTCDDRQGWRSWPGAPSGGALPGLKRYKDTAYAGGDGVQRSGRGPLAFTCIPRRDVLGTFSRLLVFSPRIPSGRCTVRNGEHYVHTFTLLGGPLS